MNSDLDAFLNEVDQWKFKVHERLQGLTAKQRQAFWARIGKQARDMGLRVIEPKKLVKRPTKRVRRSG